MCFETTCGHDVKVLSKQASEVCEEGMWEVRISGPKVSRHCDFKRLSSATNHAAVREVVAEFLCLDTVDLFKPPIQPRLIVGLDVETSGWDQQTAFAKQTAHFQARFPCNADHKAGAGQVCGLGYCVFRRTQDGSNIYIAYEPVLSR